MSSWTAWLDPIPPQENTISTTSREEIVTSNEKGRSINQAKLSTPQGVQAKLGDGNAGPISALDTSTASPLQTPFFPSSLPQAFIISHYPVTLHCFSKLGSAGMSTCRNMKPYMACILDMHSAMWKYDLADGIQGTIFEMW